MKLIATYVEGFVACFTESRSGMQQRAVIDVGDGMPPTPQELADLAGSFADRWGWMNAIEPSPSAKVKKGELTAVPKEKRKRDDHSDPKPHIREQMVIEYLRAHPHQSAREIVRGLGMDDNDEGRLSRWQFTMGSMLKAGMLIATRHTLREPGKAPVNFQKYELTEGAQS